MAFEGPAFRAQQFVVALVGMTDVTGFESARWWALEGRLFTDEWGRFSNTGSKVSNVMRSLTFFFRPWF